MRCSEIRKNTYYDSVALMIITKELKKMEGIKEVIVGMGTDLNRELAENIGLSSDEIRLATPNDFFIAAETEDEKGIGIKDIAKRVDELLSSKKEESNEEVHPLSFKAAVNLAKDANMAVISLPGKYAAYEADKALNNNMHVMLFSDNVTIEEELKLKTKARDKGLLVMGPDCGTAIINGVPLCFANKVRRGKIGVVGASGTGTQEVTVIIHKLGEGVSQVIGTGGRDLKSEIGGIMMLEGFKALIDDDATEVIVLISKPPAEEVSEKILSLVKTCPKSVVVNFIGGDREKIEKSGACACISLEDAAYKAVSLLKGTKPVDFSGFDMEEDEIEKLAERQVSGFGSSQKYLRALYTGGTLADEAMKLMGKEGFDVYSNIPLRKELKLKDVHKSTMHTCIDMGDDDFTLGKPHPMIEPIGRAERLPQETEDKETAIVLMDFVLGYGSNMDPAGEMLTGIIAAKKRAEGEGRNLCFVGYICGTNEDYQDYEEQKRKLEEAGVIVMPSNAQAVRFCCRMLKKMSSKEKRVM